MKKEKTTLAANPKLEDSEDTTGSVSLWRGAPGSVVPAGATEDENGTNMKLFGYMAKFLQIY